MPKHATVRLQSLQTCLVNLPLSLYGQLVSRSVTPQSLVVCLSYGNGGNKSSKNNSEHGNHNKDTKKDGRRAYVGWTGMPSRLVGGAAAIGKGQEIIEIDPVCAKELGILEGEEVTIDFLRNLPAARTVHVEPVSADDWEVVELHAEYLEQNLLSQVRAASPGQTVCVWVGKAKSLVRIMITEVAPAEDIAVRLTIDTEVIVAPKTRYKQDHSSSKQQHDLSSDPTLPGPSTKPLSQEVVRATKQLLRVLPPSYILQATTNGVPQSEDVALVEPQHYLSLLEAFPSTRVCVRVKSCPGLDTSGTDVSQSQDKGKGKEETRQLQSLVYLQPNNSIPRGSIWLGLASRTHLRIQDRPFELLQLSKMGTKSAEASQSEHTPNGMADVPWPQEEGTLIAGFDKHIDRALSHLKQTLAYSMIARNNKIAPSGILVCGAPGAGKSLLLQKLASQAQHDVGILARVQYIKCAALVNLRTPQLKARLEEECTAAAWYNPSLIILDDLDHLIPAEVEHIDSFHALHVANILTATIRRVCAGKAVVVLASCKAPETLHAHLVQDHIFSERITLSAPEKEARKDILASLAASKVTSSSDLTLAEDLNFSAIAAQTDGYLPVDLRDLMDRALHQAAIRAGKAGRLVLELGATDINAAQADFTPLSLRDVKLQKSEVEWADIGGLQETKRVLRETLEWPTKYSAIFASSPLRLRSGLLLYGFPGCGKTLLASAVAKECGLNFISVKGPEILNKYIGASEKSVRDLFDRAQAAKPCVLFFDEFDSIAPKRGHDSTGVTDRVVNQMLTQMDGAEGLDGVYVLAATSRPDLIDPALLRPGRLDKSLLCDMPSAQDRRDILLACSRKIAMSPAVDLDDYVEETEGFTGADLQAVLYNAHLECIHSNLNKASTEDDKASPVAAEEVEYIAIGSRKSSGGVNGSAVKSRAEQAQMTRRLEQIMSSIGGGPTAQKVVSSGSRNKTMVQPHHLVSSLKTTRPSVPRDEIRRLQRIYDDFISARAKGGLPDGRPSDEIGGRSSLM